MPHINYYNQSDNKATLEQRAGVSVPKDPLEKRTKTTVPNFMGQNLKYTSYLNMDDS